MKKTLPKIVLHLILLSALFLASGISSAGSTASSADCFQLAKIFLSKIDHDKVFKGPQFNYHHSAISTELLRDLPARPRGLNELRKIINEEGLYTAVDAKRPLSRETLIFNELSTGTKNVYTDDILPDPANARGVFIHPTAPHLLKKMRGRVNPHEGRGKLHYIVADKGAEYVLSEMIAPGSMAKTIFANDLLETKGKNIQRLMNRLPFLERIGDVSTDDVSALEKIAARFLKISEIELNGKAFIKHAGEFKTGDNAELITTATDPGKMALSLVDFLKNLSKKLGDLPLIDAKVQRAVDNSGNRHVQIMSALLVHQEDILIQKKLDLKKTASGIPMEFRVDFLDGEPLAVSNRYGWADYNPEEEKAAAEFVRDFFKKAPRPIQHLSGGADVAFTTDGRKVFIEFNMGCESGFLDPEDSPVHLQRYISNLMGTPTPKMKELQNMLKQPFEEQIEYFKNIDKDTILGAENVFHWFRNQTLERWNKQPSKKGAEELLEKLESVLKVIPSEDKKDLNSIYGGAQEYLAERLKTLK